MRITPQCYEIAGVRCFCVPVSLFVPAVFFPGKLNDQARPGAPAKRHGTVISTLAVTTRAQGAIIQHQRTKSGPGIKRVPSVAVPVFLRTELVHKNVLRRACVALGRKNQHRVPCPPFVTQQQPEYLFRRCGDRKFGFRSENSIIYVFGGIYGSKVP